MRKTAGIEKNLKERNRIERDGAEMEKEQQSKVKNNYQECEQDWKGKNINEQSGIERNKQEWAVVKKELNRKIDRGI